MQLVATRVKGWVAVLSGHPGSGMRGPGRHIGTIRAAQLGEAEGLNLGRDMGVKGSPGGIQDNVHVSAGDVSAQRSPREH